MSQQSAIHLRSGRNRTERFKRLHVNKERPIISKKAASPGKPWEVNTPRKTLCVSHSLPPPPKNSGAYFSNTGRVLKPKPAPVIGLSNVIRQEICHRVRRDMAELWGSHARVDACRSNHL